MDEILTRIIDENRVSEARGDDYVLIDNESEGVRIIKTTNLLNRQMEPVYNWYYNEDKTLVVREKISDGTFRWYIQNYEINGFMTMPNNLAPFILNSVGANGFMEGYTTSPNATIGFYDNTMRAWSIGLASNIYGTVDSCIIESTDPNLDGNEPYHEWEEPTFDPYNG